MRSKVRAIAAEEPVLPHISAARAPRRREVDAPHDARAGGPPRGARFRRTEGTGRAFGQPRPLRVVIQVAAHP